MSSWKKLIYVKVWKYDEHVSYFVIIFAFILKFKIFFRILFLYSSRRFYQYNKICFIISIITQEEYVYDYQYAGSAHNDAQDHAETDAIDVQIPENDPVLNQVNVKKKQLLIYI